MRLIATIIFIIQLLLIPGPQTVYVPRLSEMNNLDIPVDYYDRGCVIPLGMKMDTWLTELEWPYPLEDNVWDCSQTSVYTEWALENCGYETDIVLVTVLDDGEPIGHAFIRVEIDGIWRTYEATIRKWSPPRGMQHPRLVFSSIYRLRRFFSNEIVFFTEWAWWLR